MEWGALCLDAASSGGRHFSPRGLPRQGMAPPPFLSTELPQGETGTSPLPSPEVLLLGGGTPQAVTLWTVCAITSTKDLCRGCSVRGPGGPPEAFLPHFMSPASAY